MCSSVDDRTRTSNFWLWTDGHLTSNPIGPSLDLSNCSTNRHQNHFFEHPTDSNTYSSSGNQTRKPYFWLRTIKHWALNIVQPITTISYSCYTKLFFIVECRTETQFSSLHFVLHLSRQFFHTANNMHCPAKLNLFNTTKFFLSLIQFTF